MIRMFSKNRSSRRKEKNRDREGSAGGIVEPAPPTGTGSLGRVQPEHLYNSSTSPARSSSTGHSPSYSGYGNGSMERPNRNRAMSDGGPTEYSVASPLDFPMEHLQSFNATYGLNPTQRTYIDSRSVPRHTPLKSMISPTHSRSVSSGRGSSLSHSGPSSHGRANSTSNLGTPLRDRLERENVYLGEASLDRHFEQMQLNMQMDNRLNQDTRYNTTGRDRSLDREYPHMGARSLERDSQAVSRSRSMDRGGEYNYPSATLPTIPLMSHPSMPSEHSSHEFRNSLVFEMQVQISDLHKEVSKLQKDLDHAREKLASSMNSIKTFWSPELKKERAVRKEEAARCNLLHEQLKVTQAELRNHRDMLKAMEEKVHASSQGAGPAVAQEMATLKQERETNTRELVILKKTIEELEIRIDSQKLTLDARDESIKKLLEMLHNKGVNVTKMEEDRTEIETLKTQANGEEQRRKHLEEEVNNKDFRIMELELELSREKEGRSEPSSSHSEDHRLKAMLEIKDSRIVDLEKEVQLLEDRLLKAKEEGAGIPSTSSRDTSLRELASSKENLLKTEMHGLRGEVGKKETELATVQLKLETLERQAVEREELHKLLKDQIASKETQISMLQADIEGLQERIKSKEETIERKHKENQASQAEKRRQELELMDLKDQLEIKASRVNSLQRKIEGLEDTIREKEDQLSQARVRLTSTFTESPSSGTLSAMEDSIAEKDKQIERLKSQRDQSEAEHQEEIDIYTRKCQELKTSVDGLQKEITARQTENCELRELTTELQASKFRQESAIRKLESEVDERTADFQRMTLELEEAKTKAQKLEKDEPDAGQPANFSVQETKRLQAEIDRLQEALKEAEVDKAELKDLQEMVKDSKQKMGTLKRNQQVEKKKNAQLLEEARKREDLMSDDASSLTSAIKMSKDRVEELEEALRQSVIITAEREMAMAELQAQIEHSKTAMEEMHVEVEGLKQSGKDYKDKLCILSRQLDDKDAKIRKMTGERQRHLQEVYERKQEAIQAAISEKDATLALLEMTSTKNQKNMEEIDKLTQEKHKLQATLREVTTNLMKLMHPSKDKSRSSSKSSSARNSPTRQAPPPTKDKARSANSSPSETPPPPPTADTPTSTTSITDSTNGSATHSSPPPSTNGGKVSVDASAENSSNGPGPEDSKTQSANAIS